MHAGLTSAQSESLLSKSAGESQSETLRGSCRWALDSLNILSEACHSRFLSDQPPTTPSPTAPGSHSASAPIQAWKQLLHKKPPLKSSFYLIITCLRICSHTSGHFCSRFQARHWIYLNILCCIGRTLLFSMIVAKITPVWKDTPAFPHSTFSHIPQVLLPIRHEVNGVLV